ncbi:divergent polysaccharide deacteylase family protein [Leisingera thetidis]|uniref:divergent polysaccharide deacteylase family protein n=1 Tax=Leisingera thetidis TaxID=2930199 RepID=UPI0021F729D4|nr:divergent polysaccharide deacteylase family protein [Leisingera thetidis]
MRGFLGGVSVGALLAAGGLAMLSLSVPLPVSGPREKPVADPAAAVPQPAEETADAAPAPAEHDPGSTPRMPNGGGEAVEVPGNGRGRDADLVEAQPAGPAATGGSDDLSALAGADTAPAGKPEVGLATAAADGGSPVPAQAPGLAQDRAESLPQAAQPAAPQAPGSESAVVAATEPAPAPREPAGEDAAAATAAMPETAPLPTVPQSPETRETASVLAPDIGAAPQATTLPVIGTAPGLPAAGDRTEGEETENGPDDIAEQEQQQQALVPGIGKPVVPLTDRDKPRDYALAAAGQPDQFPFAAHAERFDNPDNRPLMSIVLIDGAGAVGAEALAEFPYPLSFAIDPDDPEAAAKMAARRAAGFEVLMLADLPREASPQDAETALEVWRGKLPEAVAILEGVETGVQGNRPLADQVAAAAASAGYGLVTQNSGLNTVQKLALRDGVPAGVVFRDFDGANQGPRAIRRFLDQAAFRAGQEGAVIMLGRLQPDTISALLLWGLQDRANRVALAPVSASLIAQLPAK